MPPNHLQMAPERRREQAACRLRAPVVAIDGPAGTGKSTMALRLARHFGWRYVDSGAMYRAVALCAAEQGIPWNDEAALIQLCAQLTFELCHASADRRLGNPKLHRGTRKALQLRDVSEITQITEVQFGTLDSARQRTMPPLDSLYASYVFAI